MKWLFALLLSTSVVNIDLSYARLSTVSKDKAITFLKKTKGCRVAIADVEGNSIVNPVFCVWDGIANPGTIHESTGCYLGRFDMEVPEGGRRYAPLLDAGAGLMARSQPNGPCTPSTIVKMLTVYPQSEFLSFGKEKRPFYVELKRQNKNAQVIFDPDNIITPEVEKSVSEWKQPKNSHSLFPPITKRKLPKPEDRNECKEVGKSRFGQDIIWECKSKADLEAEVCKYMKLMKGNSALEIEFNQVVEIYQARYRRNPPVACTN